MERGWPVISGGAANEPWHCGSIVFLAAHCFPALLIVPGPRRIGVHARIARPKNNACRNYFSVGETPPPPRRNTADDCENPCVHRRRGSETMSSDLLNRCETRCTVFNLEKRSLNLELRLASFPSDFVIVL